LREHRLPEQGTDHDREIPAERVPGTAEASRPAAANAPGGMETGAGVKWEGDPTREEDEQT
jgi:hypothetical protein